jgi:HAE1 family hydrophobic/amphiphilic exporter-1
MLPLFLAVSLSLPAQEPATPEQRLEQARRQVLAEKRVGVTGGQHLLPLSAALQLALKNNLEIQIERTNIDSSLKAIKAALGNYDPLLVWAPGLEVRNFPAASSLAAANGKLSEHYHNENLSLRQRTPWQGLFYHVDFDNQRVSTNNPFVSLNPNWTSRLTMGITAPLWRYRETDPFRAQIKISRKQATQVSNDFETKVIDVITRTQGAYWDLAAAIEDAVVAGDGVELARDQHERNQRQVSAGTLAQVELAASEAELQRRVDTYVSAIGQITLAENALKVALSPDRGDALWTESLVPTDRRPLSFPTEDLNEALNSALKNRTELRSLDLRYDQTEEQRKLAQSATKPQANLTANYIASGLAGTATSTTGGFGAAFGPLFGRVNDLSALAGLPPLPPVSIGGGVPPGFIGNYGTALSNMFGWNFQSFVGGLQVEWNPRNRTADANLDQVLLAERRLKLARVQLEQGITAEVRTALQALETAKQRITAAQASERAAAEKLASEVRLFQTGESTNFLVLTRQNELADSRRRVIGGYLLLNRAVGRLQQAMGSTLEANQMRID